MKTFRLFLLLTCLATHGFGQNMILDTTFHTGSGFDDWVMSTVIQNDGKILCGGLFTEYNGTSANHIVRLNPDGSMDAGFDIGTGFDETVYVITIQDDGKILVGGNFTAYNGTGVGRLVRLNEDGSMDESFQNNLAFNLRVDEILVQNDGKLLVCGFFTSYAGSSRMKLARLHPDGSLDQDFNHNINSPSSIRGMAIQEDGKIVIGGMFSHHNTDGIITSNIARLHPNGLLDSTFNAGTGTDYNGVSDIAIQDDGKLVVGGTFNLMNGVESNFIARLTPDGDLDPGFSTGAGFNTYVTTVQVLDDSRILAGGGFTHFNNALSTRFAMLNPDGSIDHEFIVGSSFSYQDVQSLSIQDDGKIIAGGKFSSYRGQEAHNIARLMAASPVGVESEVASTENIIVFPNPAEDLLHLRLSDATSVRAIRIKDMSGRTLLSPSTLSGSIDVSNLAGGVYLLEVKTAEGFAWQTRFLKN